MNPVVSVILQVYNGERYLAESIDSVLAQTYQDYELILIDDGSSDGTRQIAESYGDDIRYVYQTNAGLGAAMNRGVQVAQGRYVAFQDHDDLWLPDKVSLQVAVLEDEPEISMVFGHVRQFISPELDEETRQRIYCPPDPLPGKLSQVMLARRETFSQVGPFSEDWRVGEFVEWYLRAEEAGLRSKMLPEIVAKRRLHDINMGRREKKARIDYAHILKASLDRRRASKDKQ